VEKRKDNGRDQFQIKKENAPDKEIAQR